MNRTKLETHAEFLRCLLAERQAGKLGEVAFLRSYHRQRALARRHGHDWRAVLLAARKGREVAA